jgi:hypothetical protein
VPVVGPVKSNLCLFRLARTWRRDDFVDTSRQQWYLAVLEFAQYLNLVPLFLQTWPCVASPFPS